MNANINRVLVIGALLQVGKCYADPLNNISFVNDSDKTVYICRDYDDQGEVAPKASKCFGVEFFKDEKGVPSPRYFKINTSKKGCRDKADTKYALAPSRNYRISTTAALKTEEPWPNGCPALTPDQQAREAKTGGVLTPVIGGAAKLAEDIKQGVVKGFDATSNFFTNTTPATVKAAYDKTAQFVTHDVGGALQSVGEKAKDIAGTAVSGAKDVGEKAVEGAKSTAETVGHALNPSNW